MPTRRRAVTSAEGHGRDAIAVEDWLSLWSLPKPIIAQVHGYCLGLANELVGCCDLVVCGTSSRFGFPEMRQVRALPHARLLAGPDRHPAHDGAGVHRGRLVEGPEAVGSAWPWSVCPTRRSKRGSTNWRPPSPRSTPIACQW